MSENRLRLAADLSPQQKTILGLLRELPFVSVAVLAKRRRAFGVEQGKHRQLLARAFRPRLRGSRGGGMDPESEAPVFPHFEREYHSGEDLRETDGMG